MRTWEYKKVAIKNFDDELAELDEQGWELVSMALINSMTAVAYLRRPHPANRPPSAASADIARLLDTSIHDLSDDDLQELVNLRAIADMAERWMQRQDHVVRGPIHCPMSEAFIGAAPAEIKCPQCGADTEIVFNSYQGSVIAPHNLPEKT